MDYLKDINFRIQSTLARYPRSLESLKKLWTEVGEERDLFEHCNSQQMRDPDNEAHSEYLIREEFADRGQGMFESCIKYCYSVMYAHRGDMI